MMRALLSVLDQLRRELAAVANSVGEFLEIRERDLAAVREVKEVLLSKFDGVVEAVEAVKAAGLSADRSIELFRFWYTLVLAGSYGDDHALRLFKIGFSSCQEKCH